MTPVNTQHEGHEDSKDTKRGHFSGRAIRFAVAIAACSLTALVARADGQGDNVPEHVRPVPPPGIEVPESDRAALEQGLAELGRDIDGLGGNAKAAPLL